MKTKKSIKLLLVFCFLTFISFAQTISPLVINSIGKTFLTLSSGMDINIGEPITGIISNGSNQITQGFLQPEDVILDIKVFIEGFYDVSSGKMKGVLYSNHLNADSTACDYITIELHDAIVMVSIVDSFKAVLHTDGNAEFLFPYSILNHSYYIVVRHRNSVETWSKEPVLFNAQLKSFDFTSE